jgi:hypothetical protein
VAESGGAGTDGLCDVLVGLEGGEDQDAGVGQGGVGADGGGGGEAVGVRHADVHEDDGGVVGAGEGDGLVPVGRFGDHRHVGGGVDEHSEGLAQECLVVGEQDADGHGVLRVVGVGWSVSDG